MQILFWEKKFVSVCMSIKVFMMTVYFGNILDSKVFKGKCRKRVSKINFHAAVKMCIGKYFFCQCTVIMSVEHNGFFCIYYGEDYAQYIFCSIQFLSNKYENSQFFIHPHINKLLLNTCYQYCN